MPGRAENAESTAAHGLSGQQASGLCVPVVPEDEDEAERNGPDSSSSDCVAVASSGQAAAAPTLTLTSATPRTLPTISLSSSAAANSAPAATLTLTSALPPPPPPVSTVTLFMTQPGPGASSQAPASQTVAPSTAASVSSLGQSLATISSAAAGISFGAKLEPRLPANATGLTARPLPPLFRQSDVVVGPPCLCLPAGLAHSNFAARAVELLNRLHATAIANGEIPIDSCGSGVTLFVLGNGGVGSNAGGGGTADEFTPSPASSFPSPVRQPTVDEDVDEVIADVVPSVQLATAANNNNNNNNSIEEEGELTADGLQTIDTNDDIECDEDDDEPIIVDEKPGVDSSALTSTPIGGFAIQFASVALPSSASAPMPGEPSAVTSSSGRRVYCCPVCSKCFSNHSNLMRHKRIHSGSRPFQCVVCAKAFSQSNNLYQHQIIHTGRRPYICRLCRSAFTLPGNLQKHVQRSHVGLVQCWQDAMELEEDLPQLLTAIRNGSFNLQRPQERTDEPTDSLESKSNDAS